VVAAPVIIRCDARRLSGAKVGRCSGRLQVGDLLLLLRDVDTNVAHGRHIVDDTSVQSSEAVLVMLFQVLDIDQRLRCSTFHLRGFLALSPRASRHRRGTRAWEHSADTREEWVGFIRTDDGFQQFVAREKDRLVVSALSHHFENTQNGVDRFGDMEENRKRKEKQTDVSKGTKTAMRQFNDCSCCSSSIPRLVANSCALVQRKAPLLYRVKYELTCANNGALRDDVIRHGQSI